MSPEPTFEDRLQSVEGYLCQLAYEMAARYHVDADDLLQEARLGIWKAWPRYDERRASFFTWIKSMAQWRMVHYCYRQGPVRRCTSYGHIQAITESLDVEDPETGLPIHQFIAPEEPSFEELHALLEKLRPDWRQMLRLYYVEDLNYAAIGARLGIGATGVHWHIDKARRELRRLLDHLNRKLP